MGSKSKQISQRRVFLRRDPIRALWHDTSPVEVPLVISNDGFHHNLSRLNLISASGELSSDFDIYSPDGWIGCLLSLILSKNTSDIPLDFGVYNSEGKYRVVSLPHMRSQVDFAKFLFLDSTRIINATDKSSISLRAPRDISFDRVKGEALDPVAPPTVDNQSEDKADQVDLIGAYWPRQFFVYRGFRRLYEFLGSKLFIKNEERYRRLLVLDVQAAFPSIYTHSIAWALRGKDHCKDNIPKDPNRDSPSGHLNPLGVYFDRLLQRSNDNETNGILVGPEISRIFAEIIFQEIDVRVLSKLRDHGVNFAIYRYVDNFYAFCDSESDADVIHSVVVEQLSSFNLRLNSEKTKILSRPFVDAYGVEASEVGRVIERYRDELGALTASLTYECECSDEKRLSGNGYQKLYRWKERFLSEVRSVCARNGGWNTAASRIPGLIRTDSDALGQNYLNIAPPVRRTLALLYVDLAAYFVMVRPTDSAGVALCGSVLTALAVMDAENRKIDAIKLGEQVYTRLVEVLESLSAARAGIPLGVDRDIDSIAPGSPVLVNVLSVMAGLPSPFRLSEDEVCRFLGLSLGGFSASDYFKVVGFAYYFHRANGYVPHDKVIVRRVVALLKGRGRDRAGVVHLSLDLLSCKSIKPEIRKKILDALRVEFMGPKGLTEGVPGKLDVVSRFDSHPWFVDWERHVPLRQRVARRVARQIY